MKADRLTVDDLRGQATCTVDQAASLLGIGRSTAYVAAKQGALPTLRLGHRLVCPVARLLALLGEEAASAHREVVTEDSVHES
jgi:excisionase family DNA binding protein